MKMLFSLFAFIFILNAQDLSAQGANKSLQINQKSSKMTFSNDQRWQTIDSLVANRLPKSALSLIIEIQNDASTTANYPELIKANLYELQVRSTFEENYLVNYIADKEQFINSGVFEKGVSAADLNNQSAAKQIMFSILADLYWQYYTDNRYVILQRTNIEILPIDASAVNISQWTANHFINKVSYYYRASLKNSNNLQKILVHDFKAIIQEGQNSKLYRPTLFDFLAHKAIDFFASEDASITKPLDEWVMDNPDLLASAKTFISIPLYSNDSLSFHYQATKILQQLISFHLSKVDPEPLVDADLKRLEFIHRTINYADKDSLYLNTLKSIEQEYTGHHVAAAVIEKIALWYYNSLQPPVRILKDRTSQSGLSPENDPVKAREWCLKGIREYPKSPYTNNLKNILKQIEEPYLEFQTNSEVVPGKEFPILLKFKNTETLWFRVVPVNFIPQKLHYASRDFYKYLAIKPSHEWNEKMPENKDYRQHSIEIAFPKLAAGNYVIMANNKDSFTEKDSLLVFDFIQVSNLAMIIKSEPTGIGQLYILNRTTGKPVRGAIVQSFVYNYDYKSRVYSRINRDKYTSGNDGAIVISTNSDSRQNNSLSFEVTYKNDTLVNESAYYPQYYQTNPSFKNTLFFTDRAVYRPGQVVYFKGIVFDQSNGQMNSVIIGSGSTIKLLDVNGQEVSATNLQTNDFGSFSGSFILPSSVLTGQMSITDGTNSHFFYVEEYKRPRFEVTFKPSDSTFRLEEVITVTGEARSYTDVALNGAKVKYRVVRSMNFPYRYYSYHTFNIWPPYNVKDAEIAQGTLNTEEDGSFIISFIAKKASDQYNTHFPTYSYTIYADVIDINGETRSGQTMINVSEKTLALSADIPNTINLLNSEPFTIKASNLYGRTVPAVVKIELYKLKDPGLLLPRKWNTPDTSIYTFDTFKERLPYHPYMDEAIFHNGSPVIVKTEIDKLVFSSVLNTANDSTIAFKELNQVQGKYLLKLSTTDRYGELITYEREIVFFNPSAKKVPYPEYLWFTMLNDQPEQGDNIEFVAGSSVDGRILIHIQHKGKTLIQEWQELEGQKKFTYQLPDSISGQVHLLVSMVHSNQLFQRNPIFHIKDKNKELKFAFETFRSVLTPGGTEKWKIKITDVRGNPINSELLAGMYDASLDAIMKNEWQLGLEQWWSYNINWNLESNFNISGSQFIPRERTLDGFNWYSNQYDALNWFGYYMNSERFYPIPLGLNSRLKSTVVEALSVDDIEASASAKNDNGITPAPETNQNVKSETVIIRKNLQETAFFYPNLTTNKEGETFLEFTVPESLTRWNFMGLAHNQKLQTGVFTKQVITQKELMVVPNLPRFLREGDKVTIKTKINNLLTNPIQGTASLEIINAITLNSVDSLFSNPNTIRSFTSAAKSSGSVEWEITIPENIQAVILRITAQAGNHSDGEEVILPILSDRMMVTETLPLPVKGKETRTFEFERISEIGKSTSLKPQNLTLEFTSNPIWYAIQALPWLEARERENADQVFNRFYANSLAAYIANSNEKIKYVFDLWRNTTPNALMSALEKNQELKSLFIHETPWLLDAKDESEQKRRIAIMFDLNRISAEKANTFSKLQKLQTINGGWPWFEGMPESRYITQLIVTGLGKLHQAKVIDLKKDESARNMVQQAVNYLSVRLNDDYQKILELSKQSNSKGSKKSSYLDLDNLRNEHIQFLYALSYFNGLINYPENAEKAVAYFSEQARKYWNSKNSFAQSMIAVQSSRNGDLKTARAVVSSLQENAISNPEMGMYWRANTGGYYWYEAPVETQAIHIELFTVYSQLINNPVEKDHLKNDIDQMKTWLLKQKQTQAWSTDRSTVDAVYALIMRGTDWLDNDQSAKVTLGNKTFEINNKQVTSEPGTGYFKETLGEKEITPSMSSVTVINDGEGPAWGALYFQYSEELNNITAVASPLKVSKSLFIKENQPSGPTLKAIKAGNPIRIGANVTVRIEISTDRDLEFVHLKDMRASAFEPLNTLSGYKWNYGLWYYESTRDASTDFFINYLPKGSYVFEYQLMASQKGVFSNGITTIQCMYAPEFAAHSEGMEVTVAE